MSETFPSEQSSHTDPVSGVTVRQLTGYRAHSCHLYFTNNGLWDGGRRMVFLSDRGNASNLFSIELAGGEITRLTDLSVGPESPDSIFLNPVRAECYFVVARREVRAVELRTGRVRKLMDAPDGFMLGNLSCTADGRTVCVAVLEDLSDRIHMDLQHGYIGFREYYEARPLCRIDAIDLDGGRARTAWREQAWVGHVNTSPALGDVLTFCHEGPWELVGQRMWRLGISAGRAEPLRPQAGGEAVGHEYWFADGQRVGYHGKRADGVHCFGAIRHDNTEGREWPFGHYSMHFHSIDETLIVGDGQPGQPYLLLYRFAGDRYEGPRVLACHRGSFHVQMVHVHPRMFRDAGGRTCVVYTADPQGYGQVHLVEVPAFESLPALEEPPRR